ncbi:beta-ketoacyl synthase N-terminal-like domain-containing protein [Micromonospora sp. NPDC005194]|uniref:beta-ketoacyl synthase N-terminal-like domain-containing protein n=1 Tax=Micromonospora sp. NPDC005194 TaxID=3156870 RepID=UPI0033A730BD
MSATITATAVRTCFGDGPATVAALLRGACGAAGLRRSDPARVGVGHGYPIDDDAPFGPSRWLTDCVAEAVAAAGLDPRRQRVVGLVGTGLRESAEVERAALAGTVDFPAERLHFADAVASAASGVRQVVTLANACSAGGSALALAQDLVETGEADAVLVGGTDGSSASMLAMIGRVAARPTSRVQPFDADRAGVLLGDGAAVLVVEPERPGGLARLLATGLSCDAGHETAPDPAGILRAVHDAHHRAARRPDQVDLVLAHGTGTTLNDETEARVIAEVFAGCEPGPLVTALKGAVGHTSGGSALLSVAVAVEILRTGRVPPVVGLTRPAPEAAALRLVRDAAVRADVRVAQVDAFGFGGLNAVTLLEAVR